MCVHPQIWVFALLADECKTFATKTRTRMMMMSNSVNKMQVIKLTSAMSFTTMLIILWQNKHRVLPQLCDIALRYVSEAQACKRISSSASLSTVAKSDISVWIRVPRVTLVQFARILVAYIDFFWIPCQLPICILLNRFLADWLPRAWDLLITAMMMVCRFANHEWWILEIRVLCRVQHVLLRWSRAWYYLNDDIHCIF